MSVTTAPRLLVSNAQRILGYNGQYYPGMKRPSRNHYVKSCQDTVQKTQTIMHFQDLVYHSRVLIKIRITTIITTTTTITTTILSTCSPPDNHRQI